MKIDRFKLAPTLGKDVNIVINLSGRGDKDLDYVCDLHGDKYGVGKEGVFAAAPTNAAA